MPTISRFYGITIHMFYRDARKHHAPHIHAEFQGKVGVYAIAEGELLAGSLPPNRHKLVVAWLVIHRAELLANRNLAVAGLPVSAVRGLDQ